MSDDDWKAQADRLSKALSDHEARKKAAGVAASADPEFERLKATQRMLSALPVAEQIEIHKSLGDIEAASRLEESERMRSKAPKPLEPLCPSATRAPQSEGIGCGVNWKLWLSMPQVALWEGVALVQGIEPRGLRHLRMAGPGRGPFFEPRSFPSPSRRKNFDDALLLAERAASHAGPIYLRNLLASGMNKRTALVSLSEVVAVFVGCGWEEIPEPLLNLVSRPAEPPAESSEQRQDRRLNKCEAAGLTMPASHVSRLPDGVQKMAVAEGVTRQAYSEDLKAALKRREATKREGKA